MKSPAPPVCDVLYKALDGLSRETGVEVYRLEEWKTRVTGSMTTSGLASQIYSIANNFADTSTGAIQTLISNLQSQDDDYQSQVDTIESDAQTYQTQLQDQYAEYQAQIETADNSLTYLQALLNQSNSSSS